MQQPKRVSLRHTQRKKDTERNERYLRRVLKKAKSDVTRQVITRLKKLHQKTTNIAATTQNKHQDKEKQLAGLLHDLKMTKIDDLLRAWRETAAVQKDESTQRVLARAQYLLTEHSHNNSSTPTSRPTHLSHRRSDNKERDHYHHKDTPAVLRARSFFLSSLSEPLPSQPRPRRTRGTKTNRLGQRARRRLAEKLYGEKAHHLVRREVKLPDVCPNDPEAWHDVHPSWAVRRRLRAQQQIVWNAAISHTFYSSNSDSDSESESEQQQQQQQQQQQP
jgi:hypothetical protein